MASNMGPTPRRKRTRLNVSHDKSLNATPEKIESTVIQIREDMRELEELRKKSLNISGKVSGQMRSAIVRVEESLVLLTAKANEAEKLKKRVEALQMENIELMARHCTYATRSNPEKASCNADSRETDSDPGVRAPGSEISANRMTETDRGDFREEFRKLREFVAEEIRGVKEERVVVAPPKKSYASCVKKTVPKRAVPDKRQVAGPSNPGISETRNVAKGNVENRKPFSQPIVLRVCGKLTPYTEMIAKIKNSVNPAEFNISVLSLRRIPSGEAELRLGGSIEDANRFEEAIRVCLGQNGTLKKIQAMSFVHISDLELDITEDIIVRDLCGACKILPEDIKVTSIRPAFGNTLKASVKMPKKAAEFLRNKGRTIVGYVSCRCQIRDFAPRCFRCGDIGHLAAKCTGPDKSGKCFGCNSESHLIAECPERKKHEEETMDI